MTVLGVAIPGMRPLASVRCEKCRKDFYADLPVGHGIRYSTRIDKESGEIYYQGLDWYPKLLERTYLSKAERRSVDFVEKVKEGNKRKNLIVLDCLDTYYGHVVLKLLNAQYYLDHFSDDHDLLLIVPKLISWMVPREAQRVIEVDLGLREGYQWIASLDSYLKDIFEEYERVFLSKAYSSHPSTLDIRRFIPCVTPFPMHELEDIEREKTVIFVAREDRLWVWADVLFHLLNRFSKSLPMRFLRNVAVRYQNYKIGRLSRELRRVVPRVRFLVMGIGSTGSFSRRLDDLRQPKADESMELEWCRTYARSALVIGVHGSNMILPSAFAGATIDLLPMYKLGNFASEILPNEGDVKMALFRYRIIPTNSSPRTVARVAASVLRGYRKYYENNVRYTHKPSQPS